MLTKETIVSPITDINKKLPSPLRLFLVEYPYMLRDPNIIDTVKKTPAIEAPV